MVFFFLFFFVHYTFAEFILLAIMGSKSLFSSFVYLYFYNFHWFENYLNRNSAELLYAVSKSPSLTVFIKNLPILCFSCVYLHGWLHCKTANNLLYYKIVTKGSFNNYVDKTRWVIYLFVPVSSMNSPRKAKFFLETNS